MSLSLEERMLYRMRAKGRGWVFSARHFLDFGTREAIDTTLSRLNKKGTIRRLFTGVYDYPDQHKTLGTLSPSIEAVAKEIAEKNNSKLKITEAQAANALGLSTQVPAKVVYLTDGPSRTIKVGTQTIILKHSSPKVMATADKESGLVFQALKYLGKENIDEETILKIRSVLSVHDKKQLKKDILTVPEWMKPIIKEIVK